MEIICTPCLDMEICDHTVVSLFENNKELIAQHNTSVHT